MLMLFEYYERPSFLLELLMLQDSSWLPLQISVSLKGQSFIGYRMQPLFMLLLQL
jgi:hypothetical protein